MIELQNVSFNFNKQVQVLDNANYLFEEGVFYTISGSTDAARNATQLLIGGLLKPELGRVLFKGVNSKQLQPEEMLRIHIGINNQQNYFIDYLNVIQNIELAMDISVPEKRDKKKRIIEELDNLGFDKKISMEKISKLSSSNRFLVNVAIIILCDKEVILFDDTIGLKNDKNRSILVYQLKKMAHELGKCVILSTDSKEIAKLSDKIIVLKNGKLL